MSSDKTLGQISYEAFMKSHHPEARAEVIEAGFKNMVPFMQSVYEDAASAVRLAVIEECAKALEDLDTNANDPSDFLRRLKQSA